MAVNLIAPDGSPVNTDPQHVDSLLADGYQLAGDEPGTPPGPLPKAAPTPLVGIEGTSGGGMPLGNVVNLRAPDGSAVNADREHVESLLAEGYQLAGAEDVSAQRDLDANSTLDAQAITAAEQFAQGASLGAYGALGELADEGYGRRLQARAEANPMTAAVAGVAGAVAPALLSGGVGSAGALARLTPAGQLANLATKMGATLSARAASGIGRIGALAATGAVEAAVDATTRRVMDDLAAGNVEITAERMLDAAWDGARMGALLGGGLGALAEGASAAGRGISSAAEAVGSRLGTLDDQAGKAAFKAATGRTSIAAQRLAARVGGDAEIGKTLLKRGVIADTLSGGHTVDDIAERLPGALEQAGGELGDLLGEVADAGTSRAAIMQRIQDEVLAPLNKAGTRDIAKAVQRKLKASGIIDELSAAGDEAIDLKSLHELRRRFDQRPDLKWGATGPGPVDVTTDAMRDVRRTIEDAFERASDDAAKARGIPDFASRLKQAKREYSHLAVANQVAEQGAFARAANNRMGLNDVLAGVAGAASMGPAGALAAVGSKLIRDRSESVIAATLYRLGRGAVKREEALQKAVSLAVDGAASTQRARKAYRVADDAVAKVAELNAAEEAARAAGQAHGRFTLAEVPLSDVDIPPVWQESKSRPIRDALTSDKALPPVRLTVGDDGRLSVEDGIHRLNAAREAGHTHIPAIVDEFVPAGAQPRPLPYEAPGYKEPPPARSLAASAAAAAPLAVRAAARAAVPAASVQRMVAQAQALQDPESPESHQLEAMVLQVAAESPEMADALKAAVMRKATFVVQKMGPQSDPSDPLGRQPMPQDRVTRARNERFMIAVQNPAQALERLATGTGSAEDLAVVRELTPMVHKQWADAVLQQVVSGNVRLDSKQKNKLLFALGQPVVREQTPAYVQWYQGTWQKQRGAQQQQQQAPAAPQQPNFHGKDFSVDGHFASRADQLMGGINVE